ncbi:MAG TPA: hypothetical protein VGF76_20200 [Polyangiaceae bacterium]|jgi:hypothetical protein
MGSSARNESRVGGLWPLAWVVVLASAVSVACSTTSSGLKARFAREQRCPADQVSVTDAGGAVYHASGCGTDTDYVCEAFAGMGDINQRCHERGLSPHEPMGNPPPQNATVTRPDLVGPK